MSELNAGQQKAHDKIMSGANVHISGPGGVGKSYLIEWMKEELQEDTIFLAPTGIAALHIEGETMHSVFGLSFGFLNKFERKEVNNKCQELFGGDDINRIVIDEISMTRADVFCAIDQKLRLIKRKNIPFGGVQVIVVGDFYQLPPVIKNNSSEADAFYEEFDSPYCFATDTWKEANFQTVELTEIVRQNDETFIDNLQTIRAGRDYGESLKFFNNNCVVDDLEDVDGDTTFLCTTNKNAEMINDQNYQELDGPEAVFNAVVRGRFREQPAPKELRLKVGTKVLICANDQDKAYINGQVGYVAEIRDKDILVMRDEDDTVAIKPHTWYEYEYKRKDGHVEKEVIGRYMQFPLRHGWAITIHKCQGMSLDEGIIYLGRGAFAHGQTYVALSRMKSLDRLYLMTPIQHKDIIVDDEVNDFYDGKYDNILA